MKHKNKILVAGIGNIFFGDDAFGCAVVKKLCAENFRSNVKIIDFGIRTRDLAFELGNNYDLVILLDAVQRGGTAGTLYLLELAESDWNNQQIFAAHDLKLRETIAFACRLGAKINRILLIGSEAESFAGENLSVAVAPAVEKAVGLVKKIVAGDVEYASEK